jgi:hypothetical protein
MMRCRCLEVQPESAYSYGLLIQNAQFSRARNQATLRSLNSSVSQPATWTDPGNCGLQRIALGIQVAPDQATMSLDAIDDFSAGADAVDKAFFSSIHAAP